MESNKNTDFDTEAMREEILRELEQASIKIIPNEYSGAKELVKVIEKIHNLTKEYDRTIGEKSEKIRQRYSTEVSLQKIREIELEYIAEKAAIASDIDFILDREIKNREEILSKKLDNPNYQKSRSEAVSILLALGNKLDPQTTMELIKPIVEAKDLTFLKVLDKTSSKEAKYIYRSAIKQAEEFRNVEDLREAINNAKFYANEPRRGRSAALDNFIYKTDYKAYDRMRKNK